MASIKFVPLMISLLLTGLFILSIINFGLFFQAQNYVTPSASLNNDSSFTSYSSSLGTNLDEASNGIQGSNLALENSSITTGSLGSPFLSAVGGTWKAIKSAPTAIYKITIGYAQDKLFYGESGQVVIYIIGAIMILLLFSAVIYLITRGEPS